MILQELDELCDAAKEKNWGEILLELVDVLYLVCNLTQEARLETVLSAAFSLKHAANMKKVSPPRRKRCSRAAILVRDPKRTTYPVCEGQTHQALEVRFLGADRKDRAGQL